MSEPADSGALRECMTWEEYREMCQCIWASAHNRSWEEYEKKCREIYEGRTVRTSDRTEVTHAEMAK